LHANRITTWPVNRRDCILSIDFDMTISSPCQLDSEIL